MLDAQHGLGFHRHIKHVGGSLELFLDVRTHGSGDFDATTGDGDVHTRSYLSTYWMAKAYPIFDRICS